MTSTQTPDINLLDTVVLDLLTDGWTLLGPSYDGVAVGRGALIVELRPSHPAHGGGLGVSNITSGFLFLGHGHSTEQVVDLIDRRYELSRDLAYRRANIDRGGES